MSSARHVCQVLDEEHRATLDLLARVRRAAVDPEPAALAAIAPGLARALTLEIGRHFDFEEQQLFPRLHEGGAGDLAALLLEEHHTLRAVADELLAPARRLAAGQPLSADAVTSMRRAALEWVERLEAHVHKETLALLPELERVLDVASDAELAMAYAAQ
ncbi:MAG: hemerythrin domain-containing protein [Rubrivivax sp.]|nr:hemerythrin domain-containing protein [Rubrivivax sp.]